MKKPQILVGVAGLALGLLLGGAFVGRAHAQQSGTRYQYMCAPRTGRTMETPTSLATLNEMGAKGWRLLDSRNDLSPGTYCFESKY